MRKGSDGGGDAKKKASFLTVKRGETLLITCKQGKDVL